VEFFEILVKSMSLDLSQVAKVFKEGNDFWTKMEYYKLIEASLPPKISSRVKVVRLVFLLRLSSLPFVGYPQRIVE
jgi:hypothetical protein